AVAVFNLAFNLQSVPLSVVGASYSLAAFPTLSEHYAQKNIIECGRYIGESLRYIAFWTLPLSALFIILRAHVVRVVLGSGAFSWTDTKLTAAVMSLFAISFVFQSVQLFLTRAHYALGKTKIPLLLGMFGALITATMASLFYFGFLSGVMVWLERILEIEGMAGAKIIILPVSFSFGAMFTAIGLWLSLNKETKSVAKKGLLRAIIEAASASLIIGLVTFYSLRIFDRFFVLNSLVNVLGHALFSGLVGIAFGIIFLILIKNKEIIGLTPSFSRHE
ncbi:oligosaccharide flippase family protein, partial [Patescibacteria group bacterium]|nr:oligosaccharide flippase family protein [Patescibacteria group bacterium]